MRNGVNDHRRPRSNSFPLSDHAPLARAVAISALAATMTGAVMPARASGISAKNMEAGRDAKLLRLCETCAALQQQKNAEAAPHHTVVHIPDAVSRRGAAMSRRLFVAVERIVFTPAKTMAGMRAKAKILAWYAQTAPDGDGPEAEDPCERMAWSLARDLIGAA